jgi:hypothetical protein
VAIQSAGDRGPKQRHFALSLIILAQKQTLTDGGAIKVECSLLVMMECAPITLEIAGDGRSNESHCSLGVKASA